MADILIIDDDANLGLALSMTLGQQGHSCRVADTLEKGWAELHRKEPDLGLLDLQLPDGTGLDLLQRMRTSGYRTPVVIMTAFGTVTTAVTAMKSGAHDFIEKPLSVGEVCRLVERLLKSRELALGIEVNQAVGDPLEPRVIAESPEMRSVLTLADKIAALPGRPGIGLPATLIVGETGTGKEVVARYIHQHSPAPDGPFVHVNCTAIPENLFEMELFGHERGVFTDAKARKNGLLETAEGGTLFLDEIGDLPLSLQPKLLTAIETGRFRRLGATSEQAVNTRVIAATSSDLEQKQTEGQFRSDLYHRLKLFHIRIPPLRERGEELFSLAGYLLAYFSGQLQRSVPAFSQEALAAMRAYSWPGNVRELAHVLLQALVLSEASELTPESLGLSGAAEIPAAEPVNLEFSFTGGALPLASVERKLLEAALRHAGGNITEAAKLVGLPRGTFRYRLEKLGLV